MDASRAAALFRRHAAAFFGVNAALTLINIYTGRPWWALWPLLAWGLAFAVHYLVLKVARTDERWVEERTEALRSRSYDRGHIESIEHRYRGKTTDKSPRAPTG